ncbi:elongator complex protein 4 [Xylariales sp. AK1849]|nr:elongator complex protein 4 [Xylariales sp. AK1849]
MSFRKRNTVINTSASATSSQPKPEIVSTPGLRPSPLDGRPTTSTGTASLDNLLAGHAGLPLGTSLLVEEHGTTDFAGVLLRYYAAEGLVHGHQVHVLGIHEGWRAELPGISTDIRSSGRSEATASDKMKIAWRYEGLGSKSSSLIPGSSSVFCHSFDLTKRLSPSDVKGQIGFHPSMSMPSLTIQPREVASPFKIFLGDISTKLANSPPTWVHRVIVPSLLSPTLYSSSLCCPEEVLQFLHGLRALLRQYSGYLTAIITLPLSLHPRASGLTRWMELLCDGVLELVPVQLNNVHAPPPDGKTETKSEEQIQGLLKVHSLPIYHEKGGGGSDGHTREDMSFSLSRSKGLIIKPFSLPPVLGEDEQHKNPASSTKTSIEF